MPCPTQRSRNTRSRLSNVRPTKVAEEGERAASVRGSMPSPSIERTRREQILVSPTNSPPTPLPSMSPSGPQIVKVAPSTSVTVEAGTGWLSSKASGSAAGASPPHGSPAVWVGGSTNLRQRGGGCVRR